MKAKLVCLTSKLYKLNSPIRNSELPQLKITYFSSFEIHRSPIKPCISSFYNWKPIKSKIGQDSWLNLEEKKIF